MKMVELFTLDFNFDNIENLNASVEKTRIILDNLKKLNEIDGYYLMRYNEQNIFLGIKILFNNYQEKSKTLDKIKNDIKNIKGYEGIKQEKSEGIIRDSLPLICSISMEFGNKIWYLVKRKPTNEEFSYIVHYLANPLFLSYEDESRIKIN